MAGITSLVGIIERGARSKCLVATEKIGNTVYQLFHSPKTQTTVLKEITGSDSFLSTRTIAYNGSRGEKLNLQYLKSHPDALVSTPSFPANKIVDRVTWAETNMLNIYKNGNTTNYENFLGQWIKGKTVPTPHTADMPTYLIG